mgnify:CR=1 FL=1
MKWTRTNAAAIAATALAWSHAATTAAADFAPEPPANLVTPDWDYKPSSWKETCYASNDTLHDSRLVFSAVPEGTPTHPSGKWPL